MVFYSTLFSRLESLDVCNVGTGVVSDKVDHFMSQAIPPLVNLLADVPLGILNSFMKILLERHNLVWLARSRTGLAIFTMILSRAEILKQGTPLPSDQELGMW